MGNLEIVLYTVGVVAGVGIIGTTALCLIALMCGKNLMEDEYL